MKKLTRGQKAVLILTTIPMIAVGIGGAIGTYANAASVLHRKETALGVVAAGEGATLVAALVMIVVTMLGQTAPTTVRAALWLLPAAASVMGLAIAPTAAEMVVFALTPLAMTASAEGISLLARRIVVHRTGVDVEAQRRDSAVARRLNWHQASADHHPSKRQRKRSERIAWRLASRVAAHDTELRDSLMEVQRERIVQGADKALAEMFGLSTAAQPAITPAPAGFEEAAREALSVAGGDPQGPAALPPVQLRKRAPSEQPPSTPAGPLGEPVEDIPALFGKAHAPIVYFLRNGSRVKIGVSQNLRRRVAALSLRPDDVIRVVHGHAEYERSMHRRFADLRVDDTEWFELRAELAEYLGVVVEDAVSGRPDTATDNPPDTSGQPDNAADTASGHEKTETTTETLTSPDTRPDRPDPLSEIAKAASGPSDLVRSLATHGVPKDALVSEAVRLRPDMVADSIRRIAKRLGEGPYL
ncbi:GIY-YIG nuclease family protein [Streptomyces sp. LUP30]|uniref:GIY-YIG nuclease family protein n=1 Tax=Streptomyces sp. LUP30 TaxID=1890285 RepID=UPI0008518A73|nr:GIY-YIG nuclease family protein [Streptomyces sp. LUP30]